MTMAVIIPRIHMNGDRASVLIEQLKDAYTAVKHAKEALKRCTPNSRNYYVVNGLFPQAQKQHWGRMATLNNLEKELLEELKGIQAQES
jgi:hypothetical protein